MVSGFVTSPNDHERIFSGEASEMRIASKSARSVVLLSWKLGLIYTCSNTGSPSFTGTGSIGFFFVEINSTSRQSDCSSRMSTLNDSGSPGVNEAGAEILKQRGNLSPDEIHKLAHKGKKAACHSDNVQDPEQAKLVQINTLKAHGVSVKETGL